MKIFLTGAGGQLGGEVASYCERNSIDLIVFDRKHYLSRFGEEIDLQGANVVIHCAANTDVEGCEQHPVASYQDNTVLTDLLVRSAIKCRAKFVYISSTGVYCGDSLRPHEELETPSPQSAHHISKYLGEIIVSARIQEFIILRTGWLYGGGADKKDFVTRIINEAKSSSGVIYSNSQQVGNPTFCADVVSCMFYLLSLKFFGLYNCVNEGPMSRYEYVKNIVSACGIHVKVEPVQAKNFKRKAPVSNNESACISKLKEYGFDMPCSLIRLEEYVNRISNNLN